MIEVKEDIRGYKVNMGQNRFVIVSCYIYILFRILLIIIVFLIIFVKCILSINDSNIKCICFIQDVKKCGHFDNSTINVELK